MQNEILSEGYGILPNIILKNKDLSSTAKLVYVLISSLCAKEGYCYASNAYIGTELDLSDRQVRDCISQLEQFLTFEDRTSHKRRIFLAGNVAENIKVPGEKSPGQPGEKLPHNNINVNSINEDSKLIPAEPSYNEEDVRLTDLLHDHVSRNFPFVAGKPPTEKDYEEMNRIARLDKKPYALIEMLLTWCQQDSFWRLNIRSVTKLRKQFDSMLIKAKSEHDLKKQAVVKL